MELITQVLTALLTASVFGTLLRQIILLIYDIISAPVEFFVYRTSKIVEKGQSIKLLSDWFLNYGAYLFVFICWFAYGGSSVYNFLQRPRYVFSSDILEYIQTPDFYEIRSPTIGAAYNYFPYELNTTSPPISHANVFSSASNDNYTVTDVCFNMNNTCQSTKSYECFKLSKNEKKLFSVNFQLTPSSIQFLRPSHSTKYYQNNKVNREDNLKYYCSKPTVGVRTIQKQGVENYEINIEDNAEFITNKDNFGYYPVILLVLSTVSVFAYSRVFFMYLKDRIIDAIYFGITWKDVKKMKTRNEELKVIIKDQKDQEKEEKRQAKSTRDESRKSSAPMTTQQTASEPIELMTTVNVESQSRTQSVSVNDVVYRPVDKNLSNTDVVYRPISQHSTNTDAIYRPIDGQNNTN